MQRKSSLAINIIKFLGNPTPSPKQIKIIESMLCHTSIVMQLHFDIRLTKRETETIQLARLGFNSSTTAEILDISRKTVEQHRKEAKKKLGAKTITEAVSLGIQYGFLYPNIHIKKLNQNEHIEINPHFY